MNKLFILFTKPYRLQGQLVVISSALVILAAHFESPSMDWQTLAVIAMTTFLSFWSMVSDENPVMNVVSTVRLLRHTHWSGIMFTFLYLGLGFASVFLADKAFLIVLTAAIIARVANDVRASRYSRIYGTGLIDILFFVVMGFGGSLVAYSILHETAPFSLAIMIVVTVLISRWVHFRGMRFPRGYVFLSYSERRDRRGQAAMEAMKRALDKYKIFYFDYTREKLNADHDRSADISKILKVSVAIADATIEIASHDTLEHNYESLIFDDAAYADKVKKMQDWVQVERQFIRDNPAMPARFFLCNDMQYLHMRAKPGEQERITRLPTCEPWGDHQSFENDQPYRQQDGVEYYRSYEFQMRLDDFAKMLKRTPFLSMSSSSHAYIQELKTKCLPYDSSQNNIRSGYNALVTRQHDKLFWQIAKLTANNQFEKALRRASVAFMLIDPNLTFHYTFLGWTFSGKKRSGEAFMKAMIKLRQLQALKSSTSGSEFSVLARDIDSLYHEIAMDGSSGVTVSRAHMVKSQIDYLTKNLESALHHIQLAMNLCPHEGYNALRRRIMASL
jgi:hypothetical protein